MRSRSAQKVYSIMLDYMEKHDELNKSGPSAEKRLDHLQHWFQLSELLNKESGKSKTVEQWKKTWSDFKNNCNRKAIKVKQHPGEGLKLTDAELRLMKLLKKQSYEKRVTIDNNQVLIKVEPNLNEEENSISSPALYLTSDNGPSTSRRISRQSSFASEDSSFQNSTAKSNSHLDEEVSNSFKDRLFDFERQKEKMAHEREMARIKQNNEMISIFGRMVSVLESLSPSIQKCLNNEDNEGG